MANPAYTHDLTTIANGDEAAGWTVFSTNQQGTPSYQDSDYPYIQGQYAVTQTCSKTKTLGNLGYDNGSTITLPVDGAFLVWQLFASPFAIDDYAGTVTTYGGMHILIGSSTSNFGWWDVGGSDKTPNPYGGFQCHAVNTTVTADRQTGTPTADQVVGAGVAQTAYPSKGEPHAVDAMRWGRCSAIFSGGDTTTPATFSGFALRNDAQGNRWGLIQETAGGYLWQGHMQIGDTPAASACRFEDSNTTIFVKWTPKVTRRFNKIEIINSNSYVDWEGITFQVLDITTKSRGWLKMTDPATLYFTSCSFTDMDKFIFNYSSNPCEISLTSFTRCGTITQGGASFDGCTISNSTSAIALSADNLETITNCDFISDGTGHAIELTVSGDGDLVFDGNTFTDYASANGSTGNEALYNNTGNYIIINLQNTTSVPSYRNGAGASTLVQLGVTLTLSGIVSGSEVRIQQARGVNPSGAELYHVESVPASAGGIVEWTYNYSDYGDNYYIDVIVHNVYYTHLRIDDILLPAANSTIPIQQQSDRWYSNPT